MTEPVQAHGRPQAAVLLAAIRRHLEETVQPALRDAQAYENRVALNLLRMLERELQRGPADDSAELARLQALLGMHGDLHQLNEELCRRIRDGDIGMADTALLEHLDELAYATLAIDNPSYSSFRRASTTRAP